MITEEELEQFINYQMEEAQKCAFSFGGIENGNNQNNTNDGMW